MKVYERLPAGRFIRLLELHSGSQESPISCTLRAVNLQEAPAYDALSYVWGDPANKRDVTCNGQVLSVTASLFLALRRVRQVSRATPFLWADAVCIDQSCIQERNHQVHLMGEIYQQARTVFVHIPGTGCDPREYASVRELVEETKLRVTQLGGWRTARYSEALKLNPDDPLFDDPRWEAVGAFVNQEWFKRAWVLQEVAVARNPYVLYGYSGFSYRDFIMLFSWAMTNAHIQGKWKVELGALHRVSLDWYSSDRTDSPADPSDSFLALFDIARAQRCMDKRDHIYSLLYHPLARGVDGSLLIEPDYSKPEEDVYYEFACKMLGQPEGLRLLGTVDNGEFTPKTTLPSWVPVWRDPLHPKQRCFVVGVYWRHPFNSSHGLGSGLPKTFEDRSLSLRGIYFDRIASVFITTTPRSAFGPGLSRDFKTALSEIMAHPKSPYGSIESRLDAFTISLTTGFLCRQEGVGPEHLKVHRTHFNAFWKAGTGEVLYPDNDMAGNEYVVIADLLERFPNGSIFLTEKGYIGYGSFYARQGDHCVIFQGGFAPFILRSKGEDGSTTLISECYVHGIMKGEVASKVHAGEYKIEDIILF